MLDPTTILLVRHGHVAGIDPPRFRGRAELRLTPLGLRQAVALRERIAAQWKPAAVYTSPLGRCVETAAAIAAPFGLQPEVDPGLIDIDYGAWQGLAETEVQVRWPDQWLRWRDAPETAKIPGADTLSQLDARATSALHGIVDRHRGETIAVVAHDSVNRVLLLHALGLPLSHFRMLGQSPCGLNVLERSNGRFTLQTVNETGHLVGL